MKKTNDRFLYGLVIGLLSITLLAATYKSLTIDGTGWVINPEAVTFAHLKAATRLYADAIAEYSADAGVTIDGVLIKDGGIAGKAPSSLWNADFVAGIDDAPSITNDAVLPLVYDPSFTKVPYKVPWSLAKSTLKTYFDGIYSTGGSVSAPVTVTEGTLTIVAAHNGKTITNAGATTDVTLQLDTLANLGNAFRVSVVNETGGGGCDSFTKLLLHLDADLVADSSASAHTITDSSSVSDTTNKVFGAAGRQFVAASKTYFTVADSEDWFFGTGDFTIDFWAYWATFANCTLLNQYPAGNRAWQIYVDTSTGLHFCYSTDLSGGSDVTFGGSISATTWYHIAVVRHGYELRMYLDGVQIGATHNIGGSSIANSTSALGVSRQTDYDGSYMTGTVDEIRISKGIARWLDPFDVPTVAYFPGYGIILTPATSEQLPGTLDFDRLLTSYNKYDALTLRTTDTGIVAESVYPASSNWVDTAP